MARTFFRIVQRDPPTPDDFMSNESKGIPLRGLEVREVQIHRGISAFERQQDAQDAQRRYPKLGRFLAEFEVADDDPEIQFRLTSGRNSHYTVWGEPAVFVRRTRRVIPCDTGDSTVPL